MSINFISPDTKTGRNVYRNLCYWVIKRALSDAKYHHVRQQEKNYYSSIQNDAKNFLKSLDSSFYCDILDLDAIQLKKYKEFAEGKKCTDL